MSRRWTGPPGLVGRHDFSAFGGRDRQPVRTLQGCASAGGDPGHDRRDRRRLPASDGTEHRGRAPSRRTGGPPRRTWRRAAVPGTAFAGAIAPPHGLCLRRVTIGRRQTGTGRGLTKTYTPRASEIERQWFVVDADGETLGRARVARRPPADGQAQADVRHPHRHGDHVIVLNASKMSVSGDKLGSKKYSRHSGYPGGFREETLGHLLARRPEEVIRRAVKGMLPRNKLGVQQLRKLKVYAGRSIRMRRSRPEPLATEDRRVSHCHCVLPGHRSAQDERRPRPPARRRG